jgi:ATP-dependent exoDNAse (exonuclease V) alpha subunit
MCWQRRGPVEARARALLRADGLLGNAEVELFGGRFAVGDQVVLKLNNRRLDVRNGERGTITAIYPQRGTLDVRFADRTVRLPRDYLDGRTRRGAPPLLHGYAITAYVAQGLTCAQAFVLARDDASREWA